MGGNGENVARKILRDHLVEGELQAGTPIGIRIDQTLTQVSRWPTSPRARPSPRAQHHLSETRSSACSQAGWSRS